MCSVLFDNKVSHLLVLFFYTQHIFFSIDIFIEKLQRAMHDDETETFWKQQLS